MCACGQETVYLLWILDGYQYAEFHVNTFNQHGRHSQKRTGNPLLPKSVVQTVNNDAYSEDQNSLQSLRVCYE
jgi:hypothetical protein